MAPNNLISSKHLIAVYGNMRRRAFNHSLLEEERLLGIGHCNGCRLYIDGTLPVVRLSAGNSIIVELYEISNEKLRLLDVIEGVPDTFIRQALMVEVAYRAEGVTTRELSEGLVKAWVYLYQFRPSERHSRIGHGDYIRYLRDCGLISQEESEDDLSL